MRTEATSRLAPTAALPGALEIGALVAHLNQDRPGDAERGASALLARHPDAGIAWKILGVALMRQGAEALQALQKAVALMPADAEAHRNLGAYLHDIGMWEPAVASLQRALVLKPDDVATLVDCANALQALGRATEATPLYQRALERAPRHAEAHNNLGNAYLQLGRYEDAAQCYRAALEVKPNDLPILINLGAVLRDLGDRRGAWSVYVQAVELDPKSAELRCNLGSVLFELRRVEEAAASYRRALELRPGYAEAHNNLGNALQDLGLHEGPRLGQLLARLYEAQLNEQLQDREQAFREAQRVGVGQQLRLVERIARRGDRRRRRPRRRLADLEVQHVAAGFGPLPGGADHLHHVER